MNSTSSKLNTVKQVAFYSVVTVLLLVALGTVLSYLDNPWGIKVFTVLTDSMKPELHKGYLIVTAPQGSYEIGDIITYRPESGRLGGQEVDSVTHRISDIQIVDGVEFFYTKGDSNKAQDVDPVKSEYIVGRLIIGIPLIGHLVEFAKTELGLITMIVIPGAIIVYDEIRKIVQILKKDPKALNLP